MARNNGQVTQKEYPIADGVTIVSRTDLQGNITAANEAFIEASGYEWADLVGQPHNILRHPDVPSGVFKDFWETIQQGKPWSQIVKNRRKNGDHYWVEANATPLFEKGEVVGFMSVRTAASRKQIQEAEQAYQAMQRNKLTLKEGKPVTLTSKLNPFNSIEPSTLTLVLGVLLLISASMPLFETGINNLIFEIIDFILMGAIIYSAFVYKSKLEAINTHLTSIAEGKFHEPIHVDGTNILGRVTGRVKSLQIRLGADFDDVKAALNNATRIESALNAASSNIMVADKNRNIIFMNEAVTDMLKKAEPVLQKALPNFDANNLLNQSIDVFHQNPHHQQQLLETLTTTYNARIQVAEASIDLIVDPIFNDQKERIGTVVEWKNITEQLAIESTIERMVQNASKGLLTDRIDTKGMEGFTLNLSNNINMLVNSFSILVKDISSIINQMAEGDLTKRMNGEYEGETLAMKTAINAALDKIEQTLSEVKHGSIEVGHMAVEVSKASDDLSSRTQSQAASLEQTAASMEELTATVQQSNTTTHQANDLVSEAASQAETGIGVMQSTHEAMQGITDVSHKIGEITSTIDSIAFQTNLLALNAAVEAARAGDHGRGFAVVAGEVRTLAQRSAEASKEISALIDTAIRQISKGTEQVDRTNSMFEEMVVKIQSVNELIKGIVSTTEQQTQGIEQINTAVTTLDAGTQQNAALVEELAATANNMTEQTGSQEALVAQFTVNKRMENSNMGNVQSRPPVLPKIAPPVRKAPASKSHSNAVPKLTQPKKIVAPVSTSADDEWDDF